MPRTYRMQTSAEQPQAPNNCVTLASMGAGPTARTRLSYFTAPTDTWSSFSAWRKETPLTKSMKRCLHAFARSKKRGVCHTRSSIRQGLIAPHQADAANEEIGEQFMK